MYYLFPAISALLAMVLSWFILDAVILDLKNYKNHKKLFLFLQFLVVILIGLIIFFLMYYLFEFALN
jgi:hypothetical protein